MFHSAFGYLTEKVSRMPTAERLHIGHLIKSVFDESGMTVAEFARRIHCARPNVYSIFDRYDIGVEQLVAISLALEHDFLDDIQRHCGLKSKSLPSSLNLSFALDELSPEKTEKITTLLNELIL